MGATHLYCTQRFDVADWNCQSGDVALFAHCQTTIISDFAAQFGADFWIEGNRAVVFPTTADIQPEKLRLMVAHALRYKENRI